MADVAVLDLEAARRILAPALFDAGFYRGEARLGRDDDGFAHYFAEGAKARLRANVVFEPAWYCARNPEVGELDPLLHYALIGEAAGCDPSPLFDVAWYRATYAADRPLAHYLEHRFGPFSPVPEFDAAFYLTNYPDVGAARLDPFLHYLHFGFREFRKPSAVFNARRHAMRHGSGNPVAFLRANPAAEPAPRRGGPYQEIRRFSRKGPRFEPRAPPPPPGAAPRALALAFHLTQFHRIAENDAWWGEGFTEWTHLPRGAPRFAGHYQPRIPGELGFYDLTRGDALRAQAEMAKAAGIGGFVFYYYDFDGRRLLETPLEMFLTKPELDIGFCLMWANENWTRRWDGAADEALIVQTYSETSEAPRAADLARHFRDPRYIRLDGRPLLMVYRASLIPDTAASLARWRRLFAAHGESPIFVMAQTFDDVDPRPLGFDAAIEFPPHKLTKGLPQAFAALEIFDEAFEADVFDYEDLIAASLAEAGPDFPLIKTVVPAWDNDARRQGQGLTVVGSTPRRYQRWLTELIARARPVFGARIVAINAWNEWSEGAYLEPDVHFGAAYLNATARAVFGLEAEPVAEAARVSAFVLHRGGGAAPPMRLRSVFGQTHPVAEVVVLDEGEASRDMVEAEAEAAHRDVTLGLGVADGLSRAVAMASGEFVWIVEGEGRSDPAALAALVSALIAEPRAAFAFGDSAAADAQGRSLYARPSPLAAPRRAFVDAVYEGAAFEVGSETPALGATLWRREALAQALAACGGEPSDRRALYLAAAAGRGVVYVADVVEFAVAG